MVVYVGMRVFHILTTRKQEGNKCKGYYNPKDPPTLFYSQPPDPPPVFHHTHALWYYCKSIRIC